jgi:hypothetical protein
VADGDGSGAASAATATGDPGWTGLDLNANERGGIRRIAVNQQNLKRAWEASLRATRMLTYADVC